MTQEEAALLGAQTARARGKEPIPEVAALEEDAKEQIKENDLDDPETQRKIEFPKELNLSLFFKDGSMREVVMKTEFSLADVHERNILEDLESFQGLVYGEIRKNGSSYFDDAASSDHILEYSLTSSTIRTAVRNMIVKLSRYKEPWTSKEKDARKPTREVDVRHERPTVDELRDGLEPLGAHFYRQLVDILLTFYTREVERAKNGQVVAAESA